MRIPDTYYTSRMEHLAECNSDAWILYHKRSGARILVLKNDDPNRVFTIGFRTPPADSTGLPHILEHSVLCGSEKYPVKDPFIELEKSSLQTFLNAMTYPDKTIYPVASCNEKDFRNLMDVYMDAVLHPAIYREEKIFRQEGWHYEMEDPDSPLILNGVVYNEMKGAFSDPDEVLDRYCQNILFPDTPYTHESGGDPEVIPTLTYEDFLKFHSTYYHPSNSFIYLYGDLDVEERLTWLDAEYLSRYEAKPVSSSIPLQTPFTEAKDVVIDYPVSAGEDPEGKAYLSWQWVTGEITDPKEYVAFQVLEAALLGMNGAPLKQALTDAGIGEEILGGWQNDCRQPYFSVISKNTDESRKEEFLTIVRNVLTEQVEKGISRKTLEAALNTMEFRNREADFGRFPKGLIYGIDSFDSWLYDADPLMHLRYEETFAFLREQLSTGYFEDLIRRAFLENPHSAIITLHPVPGLTEEKDRVLAEQLAARKAAMTPEEIQAVVEQTAALKAYQDEPSSPEALATLPGLTLADVRREAASLKNTERMAAGIPVLHHEIFTSGIHYLKVLFRADILDKEEIPWLGLLRGMITQLPTAHYTVPELASEVCLHTGGISVSLPVYGDLRQTDVYSPYFEVNARALRDKLPQALDLISEILLHTDFLDEKRMKEVAAEGRSRVMTTLQNAGHSTAVLRAASYGSAQAWFSDQIGGIAYSRFLDGICEQLEQEGGAAAVGGKLAEIAGKLFTRSGMIVSFTAETGDYERFEQAFGPFAEKFPRGEAEAEDIRRPSRASWEVELSRKQEGFKTAAQIQYVALAGNFRKAGYPYTGALRVLRKILGDEYLWTNVRVKGGAYGCMCAFGRSGSSYLVSYRDPNLGKTLEVYEKAAGYLESFDASERDMNGYVIGTIGTLDHPMTPVEEGAFSFGAYMNCVTQDMIQQDRDEVLGTTVETIRSLAPYVKAVTDADQLCVVGNAGKIEEEKDLFLETVTLG